MECDMMLMAPYDMLDFLEDSMVASMTFRPSYIPRYRDELMAMGDLLSPFARACVEAFSRCWDARRREIEEGKGEVVWTFAYLPAQFRKRYLKAADSNQVSLNMPRIMESLRELRKRKLLDQLYERGRREEISSEEMASQMSEIIRQHEETGDNTGDLLEEILAEMEKDRSQDWELKTGFPSLDRYTRGLQRGTVSVIGGLTGSGKTTLGLSMSLNLLSNDKKVLYVTAEMSKKAILRRLLFMEGLKEGTDSECIRERILKYPLVIEEAFDAAKVAGLVGSVAPDVVVLDHLQQLETQSEETRALGLATLARRLKRLALERDIAVVALSQLSREAAKTRRRPVLSDLRESGGIEENADTVLFVHPSRLTDGSCPESEYELIVAKNRNGPCGSIPFYFNVKKLMFAERTEAYVPEG